MEKDFRTVVQNWLDGNFDEATKAQIRELQATDMVALEDAFYRNLEFGTGGLRGIMGVGTNRMNKYTVGRATYGFAQYVKSKGSDNLKVAIAYDTRNNSQYFAKITAGIFASMGFTAYLYEFEAPVPVLSFTVRHLGCVAGVMITASHNPAEFNGIKIFAQDGHKIDEATELALEKTFFQGADLNRGKGKNVAVTDVLGQYQDYVKNFVVAFEDVLSEKLFLK